MQSCAFLIFWSKRVISNCLIRRGIRLRKYEDFFDKLPETLKCAFMKIRLPKPENRGIAALVFPLFLLILILIAAYLYIRYKRRQQSGE